MDEDPISQIFPGEEDVNLYEVLSLTSSATTDEIKKAYRRLALIYHPDKHTSSSEETRADASTKFQQVGYAYAVLSDEKRRERYDKTGKTDEGVEFGPGEGGWETYFSELFDRVTKGKLDEMKKEYQGSEEEVNDLKQAYLDTDGSIDEILNHIPHSNHEDEERFIAKIEELIKKKELKSKKAWKQSIKAEKKKARKKAGEKEAKEAEELAKDVGVWDEFYGDRKKGKGKGKGKNDDEAVLQAMILARRKKMDGVIDGLAEKYGDQSKRKAEEDIGEEEFSVLQDKLFGEKKRRKTKR